MREGLRKTRQSTREEREIPAGHGVVLNPEVERVEEEVGEREEPRTEEGGGSDPIRGAHARTDTPTTAERGTSHR